MRQKLRGTVSANQSPNRTFHSECMRNIQRPMIEVYPTNVRNTSESPQILAIQEETSKIPILKIMRSEQKGLDPLRTHAKASVNIDKNSFSPTKRKDSLDSHTPSYTVSHNLEDTLRKTFRRTTNFSAKNLADLHQASINISLNNGIRQKFRAVLKKRSKSLPKIRIPKKEGLAEPELSPVVKHCQFIVNSIMKSHNVPAEAPITEQLEVFSKLRQNIIMNEAIKTDRIFIKDKEVPISTLNCQIIQSAKKYRRKSNGSPIKFMITNDLGLTDPKNNEMINTAIRLRKERIQKIYEGVLYKAGQESAKQLYNNYFAAKDFGAIPVENLEKDMEEKRRKENFQIKLLKQSGLKDRSKSVLRLGRSNKPSLPGSPSERQKRIENYGKWYLKPTEFNTRMGATETAFKILNTHH